MPDFTYSYDPTSAIGQCRLLVSDTDTTGIGEDAIFGDEEYVAFLGLNSQDVRMAAAQALEALAINRVLVEKKIKLLDLETDGPAMAKQLQAQAKELRRQVMEDPGAFDIAEEISYFDYSERLTDEYLREYAG